MAEKKKIVYCGYKNSLYTGPCHYAHYDRLFELGRKTCSKPKGECPHQKEKTEDALRKEWQKKCSEG